MTQIILTSAQEAALNAAGEALVDLGLVGSINYDNRYHTDTPFMFIARVEDGFLAGSGGTAAEAFAKFAVRAAQEEANPKLKTAAAVKEAAKAIIDEAREHAATNGPSKVKLDELADRIAALQVKE